MIRKTGFYPVLCINDFAMESIGTVLRHEIQREFIRIIGPYSTGSGQSVNSASVTSIQSISGQFLMNLVLPGTQFQQITSGAGCQ
jgi:hypothetical protein